MKKKIKLRDMTKEQWDANEKSLCKLDVNKNCENCIFQHIACSKSIFKNSWICHKDLYSDKFLDQEVEIEVPDILDKEEKKYLSNVIKPFRDRVINIAKTYNENLRGLAINIAFNDYDIPNVIIPLFKNKDGEYAFDGMTTFLSYTLEELGL